MAVGLVATVVGLLVDTVEVIRLGKGVRDYVSRRRKGFKDKVNIPRDQENRMRTLISGSIGSKLMNAFISYVERGDSDPLLEVIDGVERRELIDVSIDLIGRNPEVMYRSQFSRDPDYVYKYVVQEGLETRDFPLVASSSAKFLELVNNLHPSAKKRIILAMPVVVGFQVGQLIGSTARFYPLHMARGSGYEEVEPIIKF